MEQKDMVAIFNEMLTKVYSKQEQKYNKKKKYSLEQYCCTEEEKSRFSVIFEEFLEMRKEMESMDYDAFIDKLSGEE